MHRKSPVLAGFLSVVPGMGQFYNEQLVKGILVILMFLLALFVLIAGAVPFPRLMSFGMGGYGWDSGFRHASMFSAMELAPWARMLWLVVVFPVIYIFAIADAVLSARQINLKFAPAGSFAQAGGVSNMTTEPFASQPNIQNPYQNQPYSTMGGPGPTMGGPGGPAPGYAPGYTPPPQNPPVTPRPRRLDLSGRAWIGLILLFVGLVGFMNFTGLHDRIFNFHIWNRIWPFIPLLLGLKLIRKYQRTHDRGSLTLGIVFAFLGVVFAIENWFGLPWGWIEHFWWAMFLVVGTLLVLQDVLRKKKTMKM